MTSPLRHQAALETESALACLRRCDVNGAKAAWRRRTALLEAAIKDERCECGRDAVMFEDRPLCVTHGALALMGREASHA